MSPLPLVVSALGWARWPWMATSLEEQGPSLTDGSLLDRFSTSVPSLATPGAFTATALAEEVSSGHEAHEGDSLLECTSDGYSGVEIFPSMERVGNTSFLRASQAEIPSTSLRGAQEAELSSQVVFKNQLIGSLDGSNALLGEQISDSTDSFLSDLSARTEEATDAREACLMGSTVPSSWLEDVGSQGGSMMMVDSRLQQSPIKETNDEEEKGRNRAAVLEEVLAAVREAILSLSATSEIITEPRVDWRDSLDATPCYQEGPFAEPDEQLTSTGVILKEMRDLLALVRANGLYLPPVLGRGMLEQCIVHGNQRQHSGLLRDILSRVGMGSLMGSHAYRLANAFGVDAVTDSLLSSLTDCFEFLCDETPEQNDDVPYLEVAFSVDCVSPLFTALSARASCWAFRALLEKIGARNPLLYSSTCCFSNEYLVSAAIQGGTLDVMLELCPGVVAATFAEDASLIEDLSLWGLESLWNHIQGLYAHYNPQRSSREEAVATLLQTALFRLIMASAVGCDRDSDDDNAREERKKLVSLFVARLPPWHNLSYTPEEVKRLLIDSVKYACAPVVGVILREISFTRFCLSEAGKVSSLLLLALRRGDVGVAEHVLAISHPLEFLRPDLSEVTPLQVAVIAEPAMRRWVLTILSGNNEQFPLSHEDCRKIQESLDKFEDIIRVCSERGTPDALSELFAFTEAMGMDNYSVFLAETFLTPLELTTEVMSILLDNIPLRCFLASRLNILERLLESGRPERFALFLRAHPGYLNHTRQCLASIVTKVPHPSALVREFVASIDPELLTEPSDDGTTMLHIAASTYDLETIELLLKHLPSREVLSVADGEGLLPCDRLRHNTLLSPDSRSEVAAWLSPC